MGVVSRRLEWLVGVVSGYYSCICSFLAAASLLFVHFLKMFFVLVPALFLIYVIFFAQYISLQLLLYTPWLVCIRGLAK